MREAEEQESDEGDGSSVAAEESRLEIPASYSLNEPSETFADRLFPRLGILFGFGAGILFCTLLVLALLPVRGRGELVVILLCGAFVAVVVFVLTTKVTVRFLPFVQQVFGQIKAGYKNLLAGMLFGGTIGLVSTPCIELMPGSIGPVELVLLITITVFGQLGGVRGAWIDFAAGPIEQKEVQARPWYQFNTRELLIVTACIALLLTMMKLMEMMKFGFLLLVVVWGLMQVLGFLIALAVSKILSHRMTSNRST